MHEKPVQVVSVREALLGEAPRSNHGILPPYGAAIYEQGEVVAVKVFYPHRDGGGGRDPKVKAIPGLDYTVTRNAVGDTTVVYFKAKQDDFLVPDPCARAPGLA